MTKPIDRKTVDRLVVEHLPRALRFARHLTGSDHAAEEVVQEALCRILKRWRSYRGESSFGTWMLQVVVNVNRDRQRKRPDRGPAAVEDLVSGLPSPDDEAEATELHTRIRLAIDRLPTRQREIALLSLGEGLPAREVAKILETTEANVHMCVHLARKRIAKEIGIEYARPDRP